MRRSPLQFQWLLLLIGALALPARAEDAACAQVPFADLPEIRGGANDQVTLTAEEADVQRDGLSRLEGSVRLVQGDRQLSADQLDYDKENQRVRVDAESVFRNPAVMVRSQSAEFDILSRSSFFNDADFILFNRSARGNADRVELSADGTVSLARVLYTGCPPDSDAWSLRASSITLDTDDGIGSARNARLVFGGVPILYTPYLRFPIDNRRRTGLLFPTLGQSDRNGLEFSWPLYLNLGPNYDTTLTPHYMAERGTQLNTDARYLSADGKGGAHYEYLAEDRKTGEARTLIEFDHLGLLGARTEAEILYAEVSDLTYLEDLGSQLEASSTTHLDRYAQINYVVPAAYTLSVKVQDYQTVSSTVLPADEPFRRLPQVRFDAATRKSWRNFRLGFAGEYVNFERDFATATQPESGQRLDARPQLRFLKDSHAWYAQSLIDYRYTAYALRNAPATLDASPERRLPSLSLESGLRFERLTGGGRLQTLEPRVFYLRVPFRDQSALPLFDTGEPDFDFPQLFARNRFSGDDRISDAHHLTGVFTTRLINPDDGFVRLSASAGQITRFEAPRLAVPGFVTPDSGSTDYLAALDYRLSTAWSLAGNVQWSPDSGQWVRNNYALRYRDHGRRADVGYRYRRGQLEQADLNAALPVYGGWSAVGRWRYSLQNDQTLEGLGGLDYSTCCWAVRGAYRRYLINALGESTTGIYLQLELRGLASLGSGVRELLPQD